MSRDITAELDFLRESNNIEDVWDDRSLMGAWWAWDWLLRQERFTSFVVKTVHQILMQDQPLDRDLHGRYRTCAVYVGNHQGASWEQIPGLIDDWIAHIHRSDDWQADHVAYERIHPFVDGNGRTGRMFMNWQRLRLGLPVLVIRESEKREYYRWFAGD